MPDDPFTVLMAMALVAIAMTAIILAWMARAAMRRRRRAWRAYYDDPPGARRYSRPAVASAAVEPRGPGQMSGR